MTLIIEDGTGKVDAESYVDETDADAYHAAFGHAAWTGTSPEKEAALRQATQYIDTVGQKRWIGVRRESDQALDWPRTGAQDDDGYVRPWDEVPPEVIKATCEAAMRALTETLLPDVADNGTIASESKTLAVMSKSVSYLGGKNPLKRYTIVEKLLAPLLTMAGALYRA